MAWLDSISVQMTTVPRVLHWLTWWAQETTYKVLTVTLGNQTYSKEIVVWEKSNRMLIGQTPPNYSQDNPVEIISATKVWDQIKVCAKNDNGEPIDIYLSPNSW